MGTQGPLASSSPRALVFDLMGTCLDWHSSIIPALTTLLSRSKPLERRDIFADDASRLALEWRQGFFDEIHYRFERGEPQEDIDWTHRRVLLGLLEEPKWQKYAGVLEGDVDECVAAWHAQTAWPDVTKALPLLRQSIVLANGTTRLQLNITKSSGLNFDMLLSSELLNMTKPEPAMYRKVIDLLKRGPSECMMVAAHAYDLRAAKGVGMRTAYLQRWTEDPHEDMAVVGAENEIFIDGRQATAECGGLLELVEILRQ